MSDEVRTDFGRLVDAFAEMRNKMHREQKYSRNQHKATDRLYEAIRHFAPEIGCIPPFLPIEDR